MIRKKPWYVEYTLIILGAVLMGFAIKNIYDPIGLVTGGVSGLAIIAKNQMNIPLWATNTVLNIPLFLLSFKVKGWRFIKRTLAATVALSVSLYLAPELHLQLDDLLLTSLFGGILTGVGVGLVFLFQATTGGTDMLAALIQRKFPHYSLAQIMQVLDALVVAFGAGIFGIKYALYAMITIYTVSKVSDGILEGLKFSKAVYIISEHNDVIARAILNEMDRGVTGIEAKGMYSGSQKTMLFCVVPKKEIVQLKELVVGYDSQAFVIVSDAREVLGEGFIEYRQ